MSHFVRGDVVIAPVPFEERTGVKTRPAVVVAVGTDGEVSVCPVSSKPSFDSTCYPISLDDFTEGGLDLFSESYVRTSRINIIGSGQVIGKLGHLTAECVREIVNRLPTECTRKTPRHKSARSGSRR